MHADLIAAMKAGWPLVHLVTVTLPGHTIRWTLGRGFVKWGSHLYKARDATYGTLNEISDITDGIDDDGSPVQITITPPSLASMAALAAADAQGGWVTIHLAAKHPTTGLLVSDPYQLHLGELDQPRLRPGKVRRLDYDVITGEARGLQPNEEQRQTDAFHQFIWPGELGNEYATEGTKRSWWREDEDKNAIGLLAGRGLEKDNALEFTYEPNAALAFPIGRCAVGGDIRYRIGYGPTNRWYSVFATVGASGPVQGLISASFDDEVTTFDGSDRATSGSHIGEMWFKFLPGDQPSTALTSPTGTNAPGIPAPGWTSAHKLSGRPCYVWTGKENSKDSEFNGGLPKPVLTIEGLFGHDPRDVGSDLADPTTWPWMEEGGVAALNWSIGRWEGDSGGGLYGVPYESVLVGGIGAPLATIDVAAFEAVSDIADANGWKVAGVAFSDQDKIDVLNDLLRASGAVRSRRCGMISCVSFGAAVSSVLTATAADTAGALDVSLAPSRLDRKNTGIPSFYSEANRFEQTAIEPVSNSAWVTEDGGRQTEGFDYRYVPSEDQAAQLCYLELAHGREPVSASGPFKPWMLQLEPGAAFDWDEPEYLLVGVKVRVRKRTWSAASCTVKLEFRQETDSKYTEAMALTGVAPPPTSPETPPVTWPSDDLVYGPPGSGGGTAGDLAYLDTVAAAQIDTSAVLTNKIAANAVTNEASAETSGAQTLTGTTAKEIQTVTYTSTGETIEVRANFFLTIWHPTAGDIDAQIVVSRDGLGAIFDQTILAINGDLIQGWQTPIVIDTPGAGSVTYRVSITLSNNGAATQEVQATFLSVREYKR